MSTVEAIVFNPRRKEKRLEKDTPFGTTEGKKGVTASRLPIKRNPRSLAIRFHGQRGTEQMLELSSVLFRNGEPTSACLRLRYPKRNHGINIRGRTCVRSSIVRNHERERYSRGGDSNRLRFHSCLSPDLS